MTDVQALIDIKRKTGDADTQRLIAYTDFLLDLDGRAELVIAAARGLCKCGQCDLGLDALITALAAWDKGKVEFKERYERRVEALS